MADVPVGPVRLRVQTEPAGTRGLPAGVAGLLDGFRAARAVPPGGCLDVAVSLRRGAAPAPSAERHLARFRWQPGGWYEDRCELWTARLRGFDGAVAPAATALVSSRATDPTLWTRAGVLLARVAAASALPLRGGLLLHGCAMVPPDAEAATVFVGASGGGKTTMTRRLPGWRALADDTVAVWADAGGAFRAAGTPFAGKERLPRDGRSVPLGRVVLLAPGAARLSLVDVGAGEAFRALTARVMCFADRGPVVDRTLAVTEALVGAVAVQRLASSLEHDVQALLGGGGARGEMAGEGTPAAHGPGGAGGGRGGC